MIGITVADLIDLYHHQFCSYTTSNLRNYKGIKFFSLIRLSYICVDLWLDYMDLEPHS